MLAASNIEYAKDGVFEETSASYEDGKLEMTTATSSEPMFGTVNREEVKTEDTIVTPDEIIPAEEFSNAPSDVEAP